MSIVPALAQSAGADGTVAATSTAPPPKQDPARDQPVKSDPPTDAAKTNNSVSTPDKAPPLNVLEVRNAVDRTPVDSKPKTAADLKREKDKERSLGDSIVLKTDATLAAYLDYAAKQKKAVTLYLNGNDTFITPERVDREANELQFHLERNSDNKKVWSSLLRFPFDDDSKRYVDASVGISGGPAVPADGNATFMLIVVKWEWYAYLWLLGLLVLLAVFALLAGKYDILRDGPKPAPWSLGRCQMAWWFFLIIVAYVLIWLISGDQDTIPQSLLALMGISAGTALGAVMIETTNPSAAAPASQNFLFDILSDGTGTVGLHRFQILVWTIVLGIIFMVSVVTELTMPVFSPTLLATMGISAGTYLGFKFPEK
jgi:hypothetical protein